MPKLLNVLFSSRPSQVDDWAPALRRLGEETATPFALHTDPEAIDPGDVDMLVLNPNDGVRDLAPYAGSPVIQSIWAGVESFLANPTLPQGPVLCRMVDPGMNEGMTEYIVGHVLRHHLDIDRFISQSAEGVWAGAAPPLARDRKVGVLGLGALGSDAARALAALRFDVAGWSRSAKSVDGVTCFHGPEGLDEIIARSAIIVTILPATPGTRHVLNARTLALAPKGAVLINPGRGPLIDDDALLAALASGHIAHATLDVFDEEPLARGHPFWRNPGVTVTPHIAAETRTQTAARVVVEQIGRLARGEPLWHIVDRALGY